MNVLCMSASSPWKCEGLREGDVPDVGRNLSPGRWLGPGQALGTTRPLSGAGPPALQP